MSTKINNLPVRLSGCELGLRRRAPYIEQCFCVATFALYRKGDTDCNSVNFLDFGGSLPIIIRHWEF
jgi:hypothetical protein